MSAKAVSLASLVFLVALAIFAYGFATGYGHVWPHSIIDRAQQAIASYREFGALHPLQRLVRAPADAPRTRFVVYRPDLVMKGYYVFLGWDDEVKSYAAWLYDETGRKHFTWALNYKRLDPDGPSNKSDHPHAFAVLPDGSLVLGFDKGDVMARIDPCGEPLWIKQGIYHHAVSRADDGSFWAWRGEGSAYGHYNYLENFDANTGKPIRQIALVEDIVQKLGSQSFIFGVRPDYPFQHVERTPEDQMSVDIWHPNDVDVLHADMADKFPQFKAGDLLLSFAELHLVAVLDPDTRQLKWWSHGPWRFQHDPDFTSDGKISVFSNNNGHGRSEIIRMDPVTRQAENELAGGNLRFYTGSMGTHQYLPNGNLVVVVPNEGRILEVTGRGDKVMEFNNLSRSRPHNAHVDNGQWVPVDYFAKMPACSAAQPR